MTFFRPSCMNFTKGPNNVIHSSETSHVVENWFLYSSKLLIQNKKEHIEKPEGDLIRSVIRQMLFLWRTPIDNKIKKCDPYIFFLALTALDGFLQYQNNSNQTLIRRTVLSCKLYYYIRYVFYSMSSW